MKKSKSKAEAAKRDILKVQLALIEASDNLRKVARRLDTETIPENFDELEPIPTSVEWWLGGAAEGVSLELLELAAKLDEVGRLTYEGLLERWRSRNKESADGSAAGVA